MCSDASNGSRLRRPEPCYLTSQVQALSSGLLKAFIYSQNSELSLRGLGVSALSAKLRLAVYALGSLFYLFDVLSLLKQGNQEEGAGDPKCPGSTGSDLAAYRSPRACEFPRAVTRGNSNSLHTLLQPLALMLTHITR